MLEFFLNGLQICDFFFKYKNLSHNNLQENKLIGNKSGERPVF